MELLKKHVASLRRLLNETEKPKEKIIVCMLCCKPLKTVDVRDNKNHAEYCGQCRTYGFVRPGIIKKETNP